MTAKEFAELLPPPSPILPMAWERIKRADREIEKFTVSPEEFRRAVDRMLPMAGIARAEVADLDDSVILLMPG